MNIKEQLRRNTVALISLVVAITSLGYNTWRNEASEFNRTQRLVAIEVLMRLGDLQQVTWHHHFDKDFDDKGNLRTGWAKVMVIRDISKILDDPLPDSTVALHATWQEHSPRLAADIAANNEIIAAIETVREDTLQVLQALD